MVAILDIKERLKGLTPSRSVAEQVKAIRAEEDEERRKDVSYDANTIYLHGPNGLFNMPGLDRDVWSTIQRPRGLSRYLQPISPSLTMVPLFDVITGQTEGSGAEPATVCAEPPAPGDLKEEALTAPFGLILRRIDTITAVAPGRITNRAEPLDLQLVNSVMAQSPWIPEPCRDVNFIRSEIGYKFFMLGLEFEREIERMIFVGNGTVVNGTGYQQFYGLENLVNTGKVGALGGGLVPALDSTIIDWGSGLYSDNATVNGKSINIVEMLASLLHFFESRVEDTGLGTAQFALVMPRDLFWGLTEVWPCQYLTNGCSTQSAAGNTLIIATGKEQTDMRDDLRRRQYLPLNGKLYPVITSEGMAQAQSQTGISTDIYVLPLAAGGRRTLYLEHFDFANGQLSEAVQMMPTGEITSSNAGAFLWTYERSGFCWYYEAMVRPRLVLRTPWLAARIQNIVYKPVFHTFDGFLDGLYPPSDGGLYTKPWASEYTTKIYPTSV